jgi:hypothetical protein
MAPPNKCLAQRNKSCTGVPATNKRPTARRNSSARRQLGVPVAGSALPVFHRPLAARIERKLNMSCLYSTARVYGDTALTVAIWAIPLLFILWLWRKNPIRRTWVPLLPSSD